MYSGHSFDEFSVNGTCVVEFGYLPLVLGTRPRALSNKSIVVGEKYKRVPTCVIPQKNMYPVWPTSKLSCNKPASSLPLHPLLPPPLPLSLPPPRPRPPQLAQ